MRYKVALFDLDGCITASAPGIIRCIKETLDESGVKYNPEDLNKMIGPPFRESMRLYCGLESEETEQFIIGYRARYNEYGWKMFDVYEGIPELLKTLHENGVIVALATSKPERFAKMMIEKANLTQYFDFIGGALSDKSRDKKKDVILYVLDELKIKDKSQVIMIGDRCYDIEGARECGLDTIAVLWGYGNIDEFKEHKAKYICEKPMDVAKLILDN